MSSPSDLPATTVHSVSYALFDLALGNNIAYTFPEGIALAEQWEAKNLQDYCFPDGAHDNLSDCVDMVLLRKKPEGVPDASVTAHSGQVHEQDAALGAPVTYGVACYHLKKDSTADRGAIQRSMLILTDTPLHQVLRAVARHVIFPFFEAVHVSDRQAHDVFTRELYHRLAEIFCVVPGGAPGDVRPRAYSNANPSKYDSYHRALCTCKRLCVEVPKGILGSSDSHPSDNGRNVIHLPLYLPLHSASQLDQLSFGASVKKILFWFGASASVIHWCLMCRVPIMFVGNAAADVGEACRASVHLLRPFKIDVARFAPYATIDHVDRFLAEVSHTVHLVVGATNAFVVHRSLSGVVKCNVEDGSIEFPENYNPSIPKSVKSAFSDIILAAQDPAARECYLRARLVRFNRAIEAQFVRRKGDYYEALCHSPNIVEAPLRCDDEARVALDREGSFLVVDNDPVRKRIHSDRPAESPRVDSSGQPPQPPPLPADATNQPQQTHTDPAEPAVDSSGQPPQPPPLPADATDQPQQTHTDPAEPPVDSSGQPPQPPPLPADATNQPQQTHTDPPPSPRLIPRGSRHSLRRSRQMPQTSRSKRILTPPSPRLIPRGSHHSLRRSRQMPQTSRSKRILTPPSPRLIPRGSHHSLRRSRQMPQTSRSKRILTPPSPRLIPQGSHHSLRRSRQMPQTSRSKRILTPRSSQQPAASPRRTCLVRRVNRCLSTMQSSSLKNQCEKMSPFWRRSSIGTRSCSRTLLQPYCQ